MNLYRWCKEYLWKFLITYYMLMALAENDGELSLDASKQLWKAAEDILDMITSNPDYRSEDLLSEEHNPKQLVEDSQND